VRKIHVMTVVGARPQFVKAAVVSRALRGIDGVKETSVHTGQHYDANMSDVFFSELDIPKPDYHLKIGSSSHGSQTGRMLEAIEQVMIDESPDCVLVYGDTNSTLAGALAAAKLHISTVHVEAGLRSFNRQMPEEVNRVVTDHLAEVLMAPTELAVTNLRNEGIPSERIHMVGDVMCDVVVRFSVMAESQSDIIERLGVTRGRYILTTVHRAENTDDPERLRNVFEGLAEVARELPVVIPMHPRTRNLAKSHGLMEFAEANLTIVEPLGYLDTIMLQKHSAAIATDSGGMQKEAYCNRVPCVTMRDETEWVELLEVGANRLCPPDGSGEIASSILAAARNGFPETAPHDLYGLGNAAELIAETLAGIASPV
jgi:UDP-GlcNAc3NAcA epimerase